MLQAEKTMGLVGFDFGEFVRGVIVLHFIQWKSKFSDFDIETVTCTEGG